MKLALYLSQGPREFKLVVKETKGNQLAFTLSSDDLPDETYEVYGNVVVPPEERQR